MVEDLPGKADPARILVVSEDPRSRSLVAELVRSSWRDPLLLMEAADVADASQELLERGATCVILDLQTPADNLVPGVEQLRIVAPDVPVVGMLDDDDPELELAVLRAGAQDCLLRDEVSSRMLLRCLSRAIERKRAEARLAQLGLHDPLTGLPNRALFLDRLGVALDRSRRTNASIAVLFLDLDNFKDVNDTHGHAAGDGLLIELGNRLRKMLRPMDTVARFGGDEFTLLFEDLASDREIVLVAERISRSLGEPIRLEEAELQMTVSIGIATVGDPTVPPEAVIREADAAMYRAKRSGRARYELFDSGSRQRTLDRLELEQELISAVEHSELELHYQPQISLNGEARMTGLEALLRWQHPQRGLIAPGDFLPLAEQSGAMVEIGQFVLRKVVRDLAAWRRLRGDLAVAVNLSPRQLYDPGLIPMLAGALAEQDVDPAALALEIGETTLTRDPKLAARTLRGLKELGVTVVIDDYGTGTASLPTLRSLPIDTIKIDPSYVSGLDDDRQESSLVEAVVGLGHALGVGVVAEGVETEGQLARLRAIGCDGAQGFLLARPVPEDQVPELLVR